MNYSENESATLEFKWEVPNKKQTMLKTIIGFANTYGGQLIIGINDEKEIVGVNETIIDTLIDDLTKSIYDSIRPTVFPSIYTKRFDEKLVIIIWQSTR